MRIGVSSMSCLWFWMNCSILDDVMGDILLFEIVLLLIGVSWDELEGDEWIGDGINLGLLMLIVVKGLLVCMFVVSLVVGLSKFMLRDGWSFIIFFKLLSLIFIDTPKNT